jgi:hypothetical protein
LKPKKIKELSSQLKLLTNAVLPNYTFSLFQNLQPTLNPGIFVVGKVVAFVSKGNTIPLYVHFNVLKITFSVLKPETINSNKNQIYLHRPGC